jgi:hypothetical protein
MGIALNVVADARLAGPESLASHALTFDNRRIRRELHFSDDVWKSADSGRQLQPRGVRLRHENCGAKKLSLLDRGFANHPEHFARGLRSQDSFVRRCQRGEQAGEPFPCLFSAIPPLLSIKIVQRE